MYYLDEVIETYSNGGAVDAIYLDFQKAFDTVPHRRLIKKLEAYGIQGNIMEWIRAFLSNRKQTVLVNGEESFQADVLSGIPQGSVLGPLLFLVYINDLPDKIKSESLLFADDTKIFREIRCKEDAIELQSDVDSLDTWSKKWLLNFNLTKCHVLTIGKVFNIQCTQRYKISNQELDHVFEEKDLGVIIDADLKFEEHISSKVNKANALVGLIRRTFSFLDARLFKKLSFVRPHLEYAQVVVWSPYLKKYRNMLENVQIRATKLVDGMASIPYHERH